MFTRHFIVEGKYLGSVQLKAEWPHKSTTPVPPKGQCFFCPACARLWAECPVEGQSSMIWSLVCERHAPGDKIGGMGPERTGMYLVGSCSPPGSLWLSWDNDFNSTLPAAVVSRELILHLKWAASTAPAPIASSASAVLNSIINAR